MGHVPGMGHGHGHCHGPYAKARSDPHYGGGLQALVAISDKTWTEAHCEKNHVGTEKEMSEFYINMVYQQIIGHEEISKVEAINIRDIVVNEARNFSVDMGD